MKKAIKKKSCKKKKSSSSMWASHCSGEIFAFFGIEAKSVCYRTGKRHKWQHLAFRFLIFLETTTLAMMKSTAKLLLMGSKLGFDDWDAKEGLGTDCEWGNYLIEEKNKLLAFWRIRALLLIVNRMSQSRRTRGSS